MKTKIVENIKLNKLFLLLLLAISTTTLNLSLYVGGTFLLITAGVLFLPVLIKTEKPINLIDFTDKKIEELFSLSKQGIEKANDMRIQQQEQQKELALQRELAEKEQILSLATANIPLEHREQILATLENLTNSEKELVLSSLARKQVPQDQLQIVLNNIEKSERERITSILETLKPETSVTVANSFNQPIQPVTQAATSSTPAFEMTKKGRWINWAIFISGAVVIFFILTILTELGFSIGASGSIGAGIAILFLIDAVYFLPSLIYHASTGGKIIMFILNSLFGFTIIGWIILLIIASSRNSKERRAQELMHYVKHK
ncbi:superinfection immunity protein [Vagococcus fluvialis]|uniref:superinfection immunity protein n=1 Tax=Vagococcus fluvialis TaxID=2738 RepID=UPI003B5A8DFF